MTKRIIEVSAWRNSTHNDITGAGYGIRFSLAHYAILQNWKELIIGNTGIILKRGNKVLKQGCCEIRSKLIGKYLIQNNLINWQKGKPSKLKLEDLGQNKFKLYF